MLLVPLFMPKKHNNVSKSDNNGLAVKYAPHEQAMMVYCCSNGDNEQ